MANINTPVWPVEDIPRGRAAHIGDGNWAKRCMGCDKVWITPHAPYGYVLEREEHQASHGIDVPGYNVPLISN